MWLYHAFEFGVPNYTKGGLRKNISNTGLLLQYFDNIGNNATTRVDGRMNRLLQLRTIHPKSRVSDPTWPYGYHSKLSHFLNDFFFSGPKLPPQSEPLTHHAPGMLVIFSKCMVTMGENFLRTFLMLFIMVTSVNF